MRHLMLVSLLLTLITGCTQSAPEIKDTGEPGVIKAFIFLDNNHNGAFDAGEEKLQGKVYYSQQISCPPGDASKLTIQSTGSDDVVRFDRLKPGTYCIGMYGNFSQTTPSVRQISLSSNQEVVVAFGLIEKP